MTPQPIVDPERMRRVVEQTIQRLRSDRNFLAVVQQTMQAAHDRDPNIAATNIALILVQVEQLTREAVQEKLREEKPPYENEEWFAKDLLRYDEEGEINPDGVEQGWEEATALVQKLCDDFGAVKILRATGPPLPSSNGPGGLEV